MSSKVLMPGFGGRYEATFTAVSVASTGSDTIDCSRCFMLAVTLSSTATGAASGNIVQLQQSFDPAGGFVNLLTAITAGSYATFPHTGAPYGIIRLVGSVPTGTMTVGIVGFPAPTKW